MKPVEWSQLPIEPLGDRVLVVPVKPNAEEQRTSGGLYIPPSAQGQEGTQQGVVVAVGEYSSLTPYGHPLPLRVHKGDRVLYGRYSGMVFELEQQEYVLLRHDDIVAKVRE